MVGFFGMGTPSLFHTFASGPGKEARRMITKLLRVENEFLSKDLNTSLANHLFPNQNFKKLQEIKPFIEYLDISKCREFELGMRS